MDTVKNSLAVIKSVLITVDSHIADRISTFFLGKGHFEQNIIPLLASKIPLIVRIVFYLTMLLLLLIPLKIVFPESKLRSGITYTVFILIILGVLGVFFGFFQLMYSF